MILVVFPNINDSMKQSSSLVHGQWHVHKFGNKEYASVPWYVSSSWEFHDAEEHKKYQVPRSLDGKES